MNPDTHTPDTHTPDTHISATHTSATPSAPGARSWTVTVEDPGHLTIPDALWARTPLADQERFDLLVLEDGVLVLRACPLSEDEFRAHGAGHTDDAWTPASVCGLTKWTCAGCGASTIVEHLDCFPGGWLEVRMADDGGDTLGFEAVCSRECLASFARSGRPLRAVRLPGFAPAASPPSTAAGE